MLSHYLRRALAAKQKEVSRRPSYDLEEDRSVFSTVFRELAYSVESWMFNITSLIDINNWNFSKLVDERGKYRKPTIHLMVDITSKDNLVLDWFPTLSSHHYSTGEGDFIRWSSGWPAGGGLPDNRIVMIREFNNLNPSWKKEETYGEPEQLLVEGVQEHLKDVYRFLGHMFDVNVEMDLYLTYKKEKWSDEKLTDVAIRNVREVKRDAERLAHEQWPRETFDKGLGISAEAFLETFRDAGYEYTPTYNLLKQKKIKIGRERVRDLIHALYNGYPDLYDKYCSVPPQGLVERSTAKIISIDSWEN